MANATGTGNIAGKPPWALISAAGAATAVLIGLAVWALRPGPTLDGVDSLLANKNFAAAEVQLSAYLRRNPEDTLARLLLAKASVDRPDARPALALELVGKLQIANPKFAAQVRSVEGEAYFQEQYYDRAEVAWREALRLDPKVAEVGWGLLNLYALQGRHAEARALGMRLFAVEPDPHDRIQLLLQLIRHDAHAISPDTVVRQLEPVVAQNPADLWSTLALGSSLVGDSKFTAGVSLLRKAVETHPDVPEAWDAYLGALADSGSLDELVPALALVPPLMAGDSRFDAARGWIAAQRHDWAAASTAYRRAWESRPTDPTLAYRLQQTLRSGGLSAEFDALAPRLKAVALAREKVRELYDRLDAEADLARKPRPDLYQEVADALNQLGRSEEARAWHGLDRHRASPPAAGSTF